MEKLKLGYSIFIIFERIRNAIIFIEVNGALNSSNISHKVMKEKYNTDKVK